MCFYFLFKEKLLKCCDTWHLLKSGLCCLVWFERTVKVGEGPRSSQVLAEMHAIPFALCIQEPKQNAVFSLASSTSTVTAVYFCLAARTVVMVTNLWDRKIKGQPLFHNPPSWNYERAAKKRRHSCWYLKAAAIFTFLISLFYCCGLR